jgi:hypothetical protein
MESNRMSSLMMVRATYQAIDSTPIQMVEVDGVRWRGWMLPNRLGAAPLKAIDSEVRTEGRMVVWHEAAGRGEHGDDQQLVQGRAEHVGAEVASTSSEFSIRVSRPAKA